MSFLIAILILALLSVVVLVVSAPLRARGHTGETGEDASAAAQLPRTLSDEVARDEVESAREAKYREIRDAELDFRTGKLSREDYEAIDAQLRGEALEILNRLEASESQESRRTTP